MALNQNYKRSKAFKEILTARSTIYDWSSRLRYLDWKEALHREVQGLTLTASQWLDLLQVRTERAVNDAIQPARVLQRETSPEQALNMAWQFLDQQFSTPQKASQQILHDLIHGQTITASDPTALSSFSHRCQAAELLDKLSPAP